MLKKMLDWLTGRDLAQFRLQQAELDRRINGLSAEQAEREVAALSSRGDVLRAVPAAGDLSSELAMLMGESTTTLFRAYESVETNSMRIARDLIEQLTKAPQFVRIGWDIEHASVLTARSGEILLVESEETLNRDDTYPSVWHYLLTVYETSRVPQ